MEIRAHHVLIGGFVIAAFLLALAFVLWLSKSSLETGYGYYEIVFDESVTGLSTGGVVQYNGIKVGEVSQLSLAPDDPRKVIARIKVAAGTPIRQDTRAKLGLLGVTGVAYIQLTGGAPGSPPLVALPGQPIPRIPSEKSELSKLMSSGTDIASNVNDVLLRANVLLSNENIGHITQTLAHIDAVTGALADQRSSIATALKQLADASGSLRTTLLELQGMAKNTDQLIRDDARQTLQAATRSLDAVNRMADSANALLGDNRAALASFGNQGLRQLGPAIAELRTTLESLRKLADRLEQSQGILIGRDQPKEYHGK